MNDREIAEATKKILYGERKLLASGILTQANLEKSISNSYASIELTITLDYITQSQIDEIMKVIHSKELTKEHLMVSLVKDYANG